MVRWVGRWYMCMSYARIFVTVLFRLTTWTITPPPPPPYVLCGQIWFKPVLSLLHNCFYTRYDSVHLPVVQLSVIAIIIIIITMIIIINETL